MTTSMRPMSSTLVAAIVAVTSLTSVTSASAASDYDDAVQLTSDLTVARWSATGGIIGSIDITSDWKSITKDACTGAPDGFLTDGGYYAVSQYKELEAAYISVTWSPSSDVSAEMYFDSQYLKEQNYEGTENRLLIKNSPSAYYANITYKEGVGFECGVGLSGPYSSNLLYPQVGDYSYKGYFSTYPLSYPAGYEGKYVPSEAPYNEEPPVEEPPVEEPPVEEPPVEEEPYDPGPPAPITRTYNGTVDCGYKDLHGMAIVQDGVESAVTLYNWESQYRASWQHNLVVGFPYQVVVTCGGALTYSNGSVDPDIASGDWMCKPGSTPWRSKGWLPFGLKHKPLFAIPGYCVLS